MEPRKNKKYGVYIFLFIMFLIVSTTFLPIKSFAEDIEILLDKLVSKGVLTKPEAESILKEMKETKSKEMEKARAEGKAPEPEWVKNIPDWIKNTKLSGDLRLRYDRLDREPPASSTTPDIARDRGRFRLRLGAETQITDDVKVGFGLATSENGNPRSNNQTFNSEFSKKSVSIDYAYAAYTPLNWFSISGGKLKTNPIFRANSLGFPASGLIWDPDITPEGVAVVLSYPGLLKFDSFSLDAFMNNAFFILDEFSTGREPYMYVFQPGFNLRMMKDINFKTAFAYYLFSDIENKALLANGPSPGHTNSSVGGNYQFNYDVYTVSGELGYTTPFKNILPYIGLFGEYIYNPDPDNENKGYTGGIRVGYPSLAKLGDWQLAYAYRKLERDAWLDIFPDDDFYQGQTNARGHYLTGSFGITKNISTGVTYYHTENILGVKQPENRLFVDLQLKF
jgi:polyhydroxyalkanoate synthesis regulator phasin